MNVDELEQAIDSSDFYTAESLRLALQVASEVMHVKDKITRHRLMNRFEEKHGRSCAVWARVTKRFPTYFDKNHPHYQTACGDTYRGLAGLCQLPLDVCAIESASFADVLKEPNCHRLILDRVNELNQRKRKPPKRKPLADRCAELVTGWKAECAELKLNFPTVATAYRVCISELEKLPEIAVALERMEQKK